MSKIECSIFIFQVEAGPTVSDTEELQTRIHCLYQETGPERHIQSLIRGTPRCLWRPDSAKLNWKRKNHVQQRYSMVKHNDPAHPCSKQLSFSFVPLLLSAHKFSRFCSTLCHLVIYSVQTFFKQSKWTKKYKWTNEKQKHKYQKKLFSADKKTPNLLGTPFNNKCLWSQSLDSHATAQKLIWKHSKWKINKRVITCGWSLSIN